MEVVQSITSEIKSIGKNATTGFCRVKENQNHTYSFIFQFILCQSFTLCSCPPLAQYPNVINIKQQGVIVRVEVEGGH